MCKHRTLLRHAHQSTNLEADRHLETSRNLEADQNMEVSRNVKVDKTPAVNRESETDEVLKPISYPEAAIKMAEGGLLQNI